MSGSTLALRHPVLRITFWMCLSAIILIIITPTATAADGPSLEFNQSSYELNDTVEVKLTDSNLNKSVIYLNIYSSSDRIRKVENEYVTKAIGHTTVNPVGDRNNDYAVNKSDLNIGLSDREYKIKRVYRAKSASYIVDFEPSTNFGHLFLNYDNAHTVQLTHEEQNQHIGIFDITNNSSDKSRLHVQSGDNITVLFPVQLGSESYISESVPVLESNSSVNDYRSDNSTQESYSNTSHNFNNSSNPDLNNTPTPTPEPTPSPSRVDEDRGDTTPPEITSVIGFPRRVADSGDPLLEVIVGVSEPVRGLGDGPPEDATAQLLSDGAPLEAQLVDDGSTGDRIHLRADHDPSGSPELVVEGVIDRSGNRLRPVRRPVQLATTIGWASDETVGYLPGEPLAIVTGHGDLRRITATTETGWPLADSIIGGPGTVLQTDRWPTDAPVTLAVETTDGHTELRADPVSPALSITESHAESPRGPITAVIEGPPAVRPIQVELLAASGRTLHQSTRWSAPGGRTALSLPIDDPTAGPITLTVADPQQADSRVETVVDLPADGRAIRSITLPDTLTRGALLPVEVRVDDGATVGVMLQTADAPLARLTLTDTDADGVVSAQINTHALLADAPAMSASIVETGDADTTQVERLGVAAAPSSLEVSAIGTQEARRTSLVAPAPTLIVERAPAQADTPFSETTTVVAGERLRLRVEDPGLDGLRRAHGGAPPDASLPAAYSPRVRVRPGQEVSDLPVTPRWGGESLTVSIEVPPSASALNISLPSVSRTIEVVEPSILQVDPLVTTLAPQTPVVVHTDTGTHRTEVATDGSVAVPPEATPQRVSVPDTPIRLSVPSATPDPPSPEGGALVEAVQARLLGGAALPTMPTAMTASQAVRYLLAVGIILVIVWAGHRLRRQRNA